MKLTGRGIALIGLLMGSGILIGMGIQDTVCYEDEVIVWDNHSHSKCVPVDDLVDWMNEQND